MGIGWLKKVGQVTLQIATTAAGVQPFVQALNPVAGKIVGRIAEDSEQIAAIVQSVEVVGQTLDLPGGDKLKAATPLVAQVILQSAVLAHKKIENEALFRAGCQKIADGWADVLNSLDADEG